MAVPVRRWRTVSHGSAEEVAPELAGVGACVAKKITLAVPGDLDGDVRWTVGFDTIP